jgi:hypothetical protein
MTRWIRSAEFMQPHELACFKADTCLSQMTLDIAAWQQEEREGHLAYVTQIDTLDIAVWRDANGQLAWTCIHPYWMPEEQINQLHELLKERGFTGTRRDDYTRHHVALFQQGELRLEVHASRAEPKTPKQLVAITENFMESYIWKW